MRIGMRWVLPLLLLIGSGACLAQSINAGDIRGSVTDPSGALIPGVKITVLNVDTGVSKNFSTNQAGVYDTNSIVPGHYTLTFSHDGFERLVRGPITLEVGFTTVNAELKVGSTSEQVTVTTDVPLLSTETGEQSTVLDARSMDELPQVTQTWENFVILLPGVSGAGGMGGTTSSPGQLASVNGNLPYSSFLSDGASTTLGQSMNTNPTTFENVAELKISTSAFSAQYGIGGAIFDQITKSGGKVYHGTGYDFIQNQGLGTAHSYNFGAPGSPLPALHYNNFGGSVSGPVNKVKKAFFYFNYDKIIDNGSNGGTNLYTIPTNEMMTGDFSSIIGTTQLYDPTTQTLHTDASGKTYAQRSAIANNKIPSTELSSVAKKFMQWYPTLGNIYGNNIPYGKFVCVTAQEQADYASAANGLPLCKTTGHGEPNQNWASAVPSMNPTVRYFGRLDYDITSKNRITMSDTESDNTDLHNNSGVSIPLIGDQGSYIQNNNAQITDVWTINSRLVNEARLGYTYQESSLGDISHGQGLPQYLGWKFPEGDDFPDIDFADGDWAPAWINKQDGGGNLYKEHVFDPSDVVTLIKGKHILHFGGEVLIHRDDSLLWSASHQSGEFFFGGVGWWNCCNDNYTAQWTLDSNNNSSLNMNTGWAMADFMLGDATEWDATSSPEFGARLKSPQMFIQDDYKITPRLTVNLGFRYQINRGWSEVHKNIIDFDPTLMNSCTSATPNCAAPGTLGNVWFANGGSSRTNLEANVNNVFLPRAGFSWLMNAKTTVRGGFGLYSYDWSLDNYGAGLGSALGGTGQIQDGVNGTPGLRVGVKPIIQIDGTGTNYQTGTPIPWATPSQASMLGTNVPYIPYDTKVPTIAQWNLSVQREVAPNTTVEASYVGSHTYNLIWSANFNQIPAGKLLSTGVNTAAIPYPNYAAINGYSDNAVSNYNSLQAQVTRRLSNGLSFNFNYVWSHMLDNMDSSGWGGHAGPAAYQNTYNPGANYASSNFDVRQAFKGYAVYQLPFGKGKQFLNNSKLLDEAVGGWEISGTVVLSTGHPFTVTDNHPTYANGGGSYPNRGTASVKPANRNINNWINPGAFIQPANGTFGNSGRNSIYGPGIDVFNLSAHKEFAVADLWQHPIKVQFRADVQNAFNHPSFDVPGSGAQLQESAGPGTPYTSTAAGAGKSVTSLTVNGRAMQFMLRLNF